MDTEFYNYLQEIKKYPVLSKDEQKELLIEINNGNKEAFLKLFHCNLKLVVSVAKQYFGYCDSSLTKMDLIQEGNLGLLKAMEKYKLEFLDKEKFSSYATHWIDTFTSRFIPKNKYTIKISSDILRQLNVYEREYNKFIEENKKIPTTKEMSEVLNISEQKVLDLSRFQYIKNIESLNNKMQDESNHEIIDFISSDLDIEEEFIRKAINENLINKLGSILTEKQKQIIFLRYGIEDGVVRGLQEVADLLGYPDRRHVYEIEKRALNTIKKRLYSNENSKLAKIHKI